MKNIKSHSGFTIAEILVSIVVLSLFITAGLQYFRAIEFQRTILTDSGIASDLAYTNLNKFPNLPTTLTTCASSINLETANGGSSYNNYSDETTNTYPNLRLLGPNVTQSVVAYPVDGCNGTAFNSNVLRVESSVIYTGGSVKRTAYVPITSAAIIPPVIKGSASSTTTSVTIPAHSTGDLLLVYAFYQGSATIPSAPTSSGTVPSWTTLDTKSDGAAFQGLRIAYTVATQSGHTSGTWANTSNMGVFVISGQKSVSPIGGYSSTLNYVNSSNIYTAPAITLQKTNGSSLIIGFFSQSVYASYTIVATMPSGYTELLDTGRNQLWRKDSSASDGSFNISVSGVASAIYSAAQIEILQ